MSLKEDIYKLAIADLNLHPNTANRLVQRVHGRNLHPVSAALRSETTVFQVVETFGDYRGGYSPTSTERAFMQKMVELGLTRLDWICLPQKSVTVEALKACPEKELLAKAALVLGEPSFQMLGRIVDYIRPGLFGEEGRAGTLTVGELLQLKAADPSLQSDLEQDLRTNYRAGVLRTRKFIEEIGLSLPTRLERFMHFGTRDDLHDRLVTTYQLDHGRADRFIHIAMKEGWIPQFLE